jgi:hypothetical protein
MPQQRILRLIYAVPRCVFGIRGHNFGLGIKILLIRCAYSGFCDGQTGDHIWLVRWL